MCVRVKFLLFNYFITLLDFQHFFKSVLFFSFTVREKEILISFSALSKLYSAHCQFVLFHFIFVSCVCYYGEM